MPHLLDILEVFPDQLEVLIDEVLAPVPKSLCEQLGVRKILDKALVWDETQCLLSPDQRIIAIIIDVLLNL